MKIRYVDLRKNITPPGGAFPSTITILHLFLNPPPHLLTKKTILKALFSFRLPNRLQRPSQLVPYTLILRVPNDRTFTLIRCFTTASFSAGLSAVVVFRTGFFWVSDDPHTTPAASDGSQSFSPQLSKRHSDISGSWPPHRTLSIQYFPAENVRTTISGHVRKSRVFRAITGRLSKVRIMRHPGRAVETELLAHHLSVARVPFVVANGAPLAHVQDFHVAWC